MQSAEGGGSRFCRCPICGMHVALLLAQQHAESHFDDHHRESNWAKRVKNTAEPAAHPEAGWGRVEVRSEEAEIGVADGVSRQLAGPWAFMNRPTAKDVRGPRRTRKAFDSPVKPYDYLVVLDYEWTCDNRRKLEPLEIIEFPSVLVKCSFPPAIVDEFQVRSIFKTCGHNAAGSLKHDWPRCTASLK